jgi:hypothetical protein
VLVNDLFVNQALGACGLHGTIPHSTLFSRVRAARKTGTYDSELAKKIGTVVEILNEDASVLSRNISLVTMKRLSSNSTTGTTATSASSSQRSSRRSSSQASLARLEAKRLKTDDDGRYKAAIKDATNLVDANVRPVQIICHRLNAQFKLDGVGGKF